MQPVAGPHVEEGAAKESEAISTEAGSCSIAPAVKDQDIVGWVDGAYIEDDGNVDCVTRDSVDSTQKARNSPPSCGTPSFSSSILATAMGTTPLQHNGGAWRVCASSNIGIQPPTVHRRTSKRAMNSMADAMSHRSLLSFASDFGISGAFLSALEVGEIFLSCDGCGKPPLVSNVRLVCAFTARSGHKDIGSKRPDVAGKHCTFAAVVLSKLHDACQGRNGHLKMFRFKCK